MERSIGLIIALIAVQKAGATHIPVVLLTREKEEAMFNYIVNDHGTVFIYISTYQLKPIDKIEELYDQLLKSERQKVELLKVMLDKK